MAGGSIHPKGSFHKASSSSSTSASHRKSRWESSTTTTTTTTNTVAANTKNPSAADPKPPKSKNDPSPKSGPTPSPAHSKPLTDPPHHPGAAGPVRSPGALFPFMDPATMGPPPAPPYGFHMLERRTIVLADGSVRSYFALPLDYQDLPAPPPPRPLDSAGRFLLVGPGGLGHHELGGGFDRRLPPPGGPMSPGGFNRHQDYWNSLGLDGRGHMEGSMKRKFTEEEEKDLRRDEKEQLLKQRQQLMQYGHQNGFPVSGPGGRGGQFLSGASGEESRAAKYIRIGDSYENVGLRQSGGGGSSGNAGLKHLEVDQNALKKAFLNFCKLINENPHQRKNYLEEGKLSRLQCIACGRSSKEFPDMHSLIMHTYNSDNADLYVDHLGLHKALCALMGWNYSKPPDNSKAYQFLSADEAATNQDDLIIWPPMVIIHNTITGKGKDGRMEGFGNKAMDNIIRDLGFTGGKSKSLYGREGHLGVTLMKFAGDQAGLKDAIHLAEFLEKDNRGRKAWTRLQPLTIGSKDDENNPNLVKYDEKSRERKRVFYGYLGTAFDLDKIDFDSRKKVTIESKREYRSSK